MKMKSVLAVGVAMALLVVGGLPAWAEEEAVIEVGQAVADFTLPNPISGEEVNFERDIKGKAKATVISFMNTACTVCIAETRLLDAMAGENPSLKVYTVLVDARGKVAAQAYDKAYQFKNITYLLDPQFEVPATYGFTFTPALILAGEDGIVRWKKGGYSVRKKDEFVAELKKFL